MRQPTKAIIAAAGMGTRFLPQTKAMPKEMLPIIDKPVIQIIVEQLVETGVTDIIIVTGTTKRAIEDHFDRSDELENDLRHKGKDKLADEIEKIGNMANFVYLRQKGTPKGNARPLINASHLLDDDEPFFMLFADEFFRSKVPHAKQLLNAYNKTGGTVVSLIEVDKSAASKYAMAELTGEPHKGYGKINQLIEKPGPDKTPSTYASVGGYLITPGVMPFIRKEKIGHGGEIVIADSINEYAKDGGNVTGAFIDGVYHDAGDKLSYIQAVVDHALEDETFGNEFKQYLKSRLKEK